MTSEQQNQSSQSTQNTQYDKIGTKYNAIKVLPSVEPEEPSVTRALGNIEGKRCLGTSTFYHPAKVILHGSTTATNNEIRDKSDLT